MKISKYIFLILIFLLPLSVKGIGVSVSPIKLEIKYLENSKDYLKIKNISQEIVYVSIYPDAFQNNIKIYPEEVQLLPEQTTKIEIDTNFGKEKKDQILKTNISVITKALDKKNFNAASGIKIPINIIIEKQNNYSKLFLFFILGIFILAIIFIFISKYNNKKNNFFHKLKKLFKREIKKEKINFFNLLK